MGFTIHYESITDTLTYTETPKNNQHVYSYVESFAFVENDEETEPKESVHDNLIFSPRTDYDISGHRSLTDTLSFRDAAYRNQVGDVYENLIIHETYSPGNKWKLINQSLLFTESVIAYGAAGGYDKLIFNETIKLKFQRSRLITQSFSVQQSVTLGFARVTYVAPVIPDEPGGPNPVLIVPTVTPGKTVTFTSTLSPIYVTLRAPDFGNKDSVKATRIQRTTRGGELIIFRDPLWTRGETFELDFSYMTDLEARTVQIFCQNTLGQVVTYTDFEGNVWSGIILTPQLDIKKTGRYNNTFTITFEVV